MAERDLLSRPKAARMVGGAANLKRLVAARVIVPVALPNEREGYLESELIRWQEASRVSRRTATQYTNDELRAMTDAGYARAAGARA